MFMLHPVAMTQTPSGVTKHAVFLMLKKCLGVYLLQNVYPNIAGVDTGGRAMGAVAPPPPLAGQTGANVVGGASIN